MVVSPRARLLTFLLIPGAATLAAQQPTVTGGQPATPLAAPADPTAAHELRLDVVVTDHSGKPIPGLTETDFTVLDNEQPTPVTSFRAVPSSPNAPNPAKLILLIDEVNTDFQHVANTRDAVRKFLLSEGGHLGHPISLVFFSDNGTEVVDNKDGDGNVLVTALAEHATQLRTIRRSQGIYGASDRFELSLRTLGALANTEAQTPGRKILIWISPGWPYLSGPQITLSNHDQQLLFNSVVEVQKALRRARITVSSVDPIGAGASVFRSTFYQDFLKGVAKPSDVQAANLSLQVIAAGSGGRVLSGSNDATREIREAASDADAYYVLTLSPATADKPNQYHALQVKSTGGSVRTLAGYYAQP